MTEENNQNQNRDVMTETDEESLQNWLRKETPYLDTGNLYVYVVSLAIAATVPSVAMLGVLAYTFVFGYKLFIAKDFQRKVEVERKGEVIEGGTE